MSDIASIPGAAEPLYFGPADATLFGWYHRPEPPRDGLGVVIAPPFGREHASAYRGLRRLAEELAAAGHPVLRFDYHGMGDSSGSDWEPGRVAAWIASVGHAVDEVRRLGEVSSVAIVGLRVGALLAVAAAAAREDVGALVLWAPVASGRAYLREVRALASMVGEEGRQADGGWTSSELAMTRETEEALARLDLSALVRAPAPRALILARDDVVTADARDVGERLVRAGTRVSHDTVSGWRELVKPPHDVVLPQAVLARIAHWLASDVPPVRERGLAALVPQVMGLRGSPAPPLEEGLVPAAFDVEERPFRADGGRLFGILARPAGAVPATRPAIVLANAGSVYRVGPNRLHVTLARLWAARGFPVLRLDMGGIGDSRAAGGLRENDPYSEGAVDDLAIALDELRDALGQRPSVLMGLCSGAHATFHAALELGTVTGAVLVNPIVFHWSPGDSLEVAAYRSHDATRHYRARLRDPAAWGRLLTSGSRVREAARLVLEQLGLSLSALAGSVRRTVRRTLGRPPVEDDAGEELRRIVARGTDLMLLFSKDEPGLAYLLRHHRGDLRRLAHEPRFALQVLPHAGHTLATLPAQQDAASRLTRFLMGRFAATILGGVAPIPAIVEAMR